MSPNRDRPGGLGALLRLHDDRYEVGPAAPAKYPKRKRGSDRRMGSTPWLWWGILQANALNALIGGIGANKSALSAFVAAHVSTGRPFPFDNAASDIVSVLKEQRRVLELFRNHFGRFQDGFQQVPRRQAA